MVLLLHRIAASLVLPHLARYGFTTRRSFGSALDKLRQRMLAHD